MAGALAGSSEPSRPPRIKAGSMGWLNLGRQSTVDAAHCRRLAFHVDGLYDFMSLPNQAVTDCTTQPSPVGLKQTSFNEAPVLLPVRPLIWFSTPDHHSRVS